MIRISNSDNKDWESCRLWDIYETTQPSYIEALAKDERAFAEIGPTYMGFVNDYRLLAELIPKGRTVYDFGCSYGAQAWYFREHKKYIGIDSELTVHPMFENAIWMKARIQDILTKRGAFGFTGMGFAIVNYVPDFEAMRLVQSAFRDCFTFYPHESDFPRLFFKRNTTTPHTERNK